MKNSFPLFVSHRDRCDECRNSYHLSCLQPPAKKTPKVKGYKWYCHQCESSSSSSGKEGVGNNNDDDNEDGESRNQLASDDSESDSENNDAAGEKADSDESREQ